MIHVRYDNIELKKTLKYASRKILSYMLLYQNLTIFVEMNIKVNQLISMRIHFQTQKSGPIEYLKILHLLRVFSLVRELLKARISSFKNLNFQIIIYFELVISCISIDTPVKQHWKVVNLTKLSSWSL